MRGLSIALAGDGHQFNIWLSHASKRFPGATFYDRSPMITAFRQAEVNLGDQGWLDSEGQASARRTAKNLANPLTVDVTLTFAGKFQNGTVTVKCKNGTEKVLRVRINGLAEEMINRAFYHVDAAITRCKTSGPRA